VSKQQREINQRALGKHFGHACEGHLRGTIQQLPGISEAQVKRQLPFEFPVAPDAVVLDDCGKVRAVVIVAFWANAHNSEAKFYRTRLEYNEMRRAQQEQPEWFANDFVLATVIYGSPDGWKKQILNDLAKQCSPLVFLPAAIGAAAADSVVQRAFGVYSAAWESGRSDARAEVEKYFAKAELTSAESSLLELVGMLLGEAGDHKAKKASAEQDYSVEARLPVQVTRVGEERAEWPGRQTETTPRLRARVPASAFSTRLRQALGVLSLFHPKEIEAWQKHGQRLADKRAENFARRAFFLDMGWFWESKSLLGSTIAFSLRRPIRAAGNKEVYAPDLPDFQDWTRLQPALVADILERHRARTHNPTEVFQGGAYDQIAGNWSAICSAVVGHIPLLTAHIAQGDKPAFSRELTGEQPITAESWHPASGMACHYPLWALVTCAVAIDQDNRGIRGEFDTRRQDPPTASKVSELFDATRSASGVITLLNELTRFCAILRSENLTSLIGTERPRLLSLNEPASWWADFYNTLTTNSSHNPLNEIVYPWLRRRYPGLHWHGWPERRSRSLQDVISPNAGRRQWQFLGTDDDQQSLLAAEVKSITQNNWGNKSKELYDRVAEARAGARELGWTVHTLCVLDGDFGTEQLQELSTGIGHDELVSIDELLAEWKSE
jgi:hypothetical protein